MSGLLSVRTRGFRGPGPINLESRHGESGVRGGNEPPFSVAVLAAGEVPRAGLECPKQDSTRRAPSSERLRTSSWLGCRREPGAGSWVRSGPQGTFSSLGHGATPKTDGGWANSQASGKRRLSHPPAEEGGRSTSPILDRASVADPKYHGRAGRILRCQSVELSSPQAWRMSKYNTSLLFPMLTTATVPRMKAIVQDRYGSSQDLRLSEVEVPTLDESSVLVRVRAASINALDWRIVAGRPFLGRLLAFGLLRPKRRIRGVDVAGVVEAVGGKVSRFKVGDEVFGLGSGSFAEYAAADEKELDHKPSGVTFPQAATLGIAAITALQALRDLGHVERGQRVLVTAAGSGVGTFAVQLARSWGARVIAVTSSSNLELVRSLGAVDVIDYTKEDFTRRPERYDVILDISGTRGLIATHRALAPEGLLVLVGGRGGFGRFIKGGILRRFGLRIRTLMARPRSADLRLLGDLVRRGELRPVIDREYPLNQAREAMAYAEEHRTQGKIVIDVG